jgi:hypothetical protein
LFGGYHDDYGLWNGAMVVGRCVRGGNHYSPEAGILDIQQFNASTASDVVVEKKKHKKRPNLNAGAEF